MIAMDRFQAICYPMNNHFWQPSRLDTIQDFLCKLGMKPPMHYAAIEHHHFFSILCHRAELRRFRAKPSRAELSQVGALQCLN